ncbi:hypothetical protein AYI68_g685 [Smittium mucronatum]|uniref:Uncharacterized protein n=1 Tax=Smittium mucronatum TaxID=133383 RepID=A0A1R0H7Q0_9FUNG|nr:hypothetical protein AYI68_g685 [Smittium mucronatum]
MIRRKYYLTYLELQDPFMNILLLPVSRFTILTIVDSIGIHQYPSTCIEIGQIKRNASLSLLGRSANHGSLQGRMCSYHAQDIIQALGACTQVQRREIVNFPIPIYYTPEYCDKNQRYDTQCAVNQGKTSGALESLSADFDIMDIDSDSNETSHSEPIVLEESAEVVERAHFLARDSGTRNFHRIQRLGFGNRTESWKSTQLVPRRQVFQAEFAGIQMERVQKSMRMPTLEPTISDDTEGTTKSNNYDHNDSNVKISIMASRFDVSFSDPASSPASKHNNS